MAIEAGGRFRMWMVATALAALMLIFSAADPGVASAGCKKADAQSDQISKKRARSAVKCLINKERNASNLKSNGQLKDAAQGHTGYMRSHNCFSHLCSGEASLESRIRRTGYLNGVNGYGFGEVIALNSDNASPRDIVRQWMNSPPHRALITSGQFEHVGVGVSAKNGRAYYTAVLGARSG